MRTARQSQFMSSSTGSPLPPVWKALESKGTRFIRGQLALVCAAPGVGKSALVLAYAVKSRSPCLYFSADSDQFIQTSRMLSIEKDWPLSRSGDMVRSMSMTDELDHLPIHWNYEASPTLKLIDMELEAYAEFYGDYPELVVVDNVTNVLTKASEEDPFAGLELLMEDLHKTARDTGACVIGLHHVTGTYNNGNVPIPLGGIKGQITRIPEVVLSLHRIPEVPSFGALLNGQRGDSLRVSTIKNRSGKSDPSGMDFVELSFRGESMQILDIQ